MNKDELMEIANTIYMEYSYLNLDQEKYYFYINNLINKLGDNLDLVLYKNEINNYLKRIIKEFFCNNNPFLLFNKYINKISVNDLKYSFNYLKKITNFINLYYKNYDQDFLIKLIKENEKLNMLLESFINNNISKLSKFKLDDTFYNMIQVYCMLNEINLDNDEYFEDNANLSDDPLVAYYKEIKQYPILTKDEERNLFKQIEEGSLEARDYVIKCNLKLVTLYAKYYKGRGVNYFDLIQEGNMGLIHAVDKFDYRLGYRFSTYATWWIRDSLSKISSKNFDSLGLSTHIIRKIIQYKKIRRELENELNREVTFIEIADKLNMSLDYVKKLDILSQSAISLNNKMNDDTDSELQDFLEDKNIDVENNAIDNTLYDQAMSILKQANVSDRDIKVFKERYGIETGEIKSLSEVASNNNLSRERVRQIEKHILKILQKIKPKEISILIEDKELNTDVYFNNEDWLNNVYIHLQKYGSIIDMRKVLSLLDEEELNLLKNVYGERNLKSLNVLTKDENLFYNVLLPKIRAFYEDLKSEKVYMNENKDLLINIRKSLNLLKKQLSHDFYDKLNQLEKIILALNINKINYNIDKKVLIDYLNISYEKYLEIEKNVLYLYKEYITELNNKFINNYHKKL